MYILFEEHQYESCLVEKVLKDIYVLQDVNKKVSVQYVGYFYNPHLHDCVFILPKVLLTEQETLVGMELPNGEQVSPEQVLTPEGQKKLSKEYRKFIYEFSVWIYRALSVFYKANPDSKAILYKHLPQAGRGKRHRANTYLDIVLSLINFNQENKDFVLFTIKNLHRGNNKINWTRTISHSQAFVQGNDVIYLNPINKKRIINYEEELFVIFYSILNYLNSEYGFHTPINIQYDLITGRQFEQYLRGMGKTRLMQIKYKYFSDKALQLWDLCYAFFENSYRIAINTHAQEYILAKSFNIVFEAMIDELIGTPHNKIPKGLADQDDGKRVDHIYTDLALTSADAQTNREVYYIGDSKYYKSGHSLTSESIYKQYTYARNVIQWNVNLFAADDTHFDEKEKAQRKADKENFSDIHLQDNSLTEGYDVIPNFFISAFVYKDHRYNDGENNIKKHFDKGGKHCTKVSYQFPDRLFDRDTLFLSQYDVNFLYILYLYGRNKANEKAQWKQHVHKIFRDEIRDVIQKEFIIYAMRARLGVDGALYLQQHFYELNGRIFQPYGEERTTYFAYARPTKNLENTQAQYDELSQHFVIEKCDMGKDPKEVLKEKVEEELQKPVNMPSQWLTLHYLERYTGKGILVGYYKDEAHLQWILGNNDKGSLVYNVRLQVQGEEPRAGAHTAGFYSKKNVQFVILYTDGVETTSEYRVFHVKDTASKVTEERMRGTWYPFDVKGPHFFFRFDEQVNIGHLDIKALLTDMKQKHLEESKEYVTGEPLFCTAEEVLKYRKKL
ncbi:MAG: restriction endonuclease [Bacteroidaceae bacterium]|nr:restriction endonuclease [Bacteroidaceae bacterium]